MATTKTTTKKTASRTTKVDNTENTSAMQSEIDTLREQVASLQLEVSRLAAAPAATAGGDTVTRDQLASALRAMGAREWVITKAGLRQSTAQVS